MLKPALDMQYIDRPIVAAEEKILVIYHAACDDGFGAAWVLNNLFINHPKENITYYAAEYGQTLPQYFAAGTLVYIVDFSYAPVQLTDIAEVAKFVTVIDHHQSAIAALKGYSHPRVRLVLADDASGALLTWRYFAGRNRPDPWLLRHIDDNDRWKFAHTDTKRIIAALRSYPQDFGTWDMLYLRGRYALMQEGEHIIRAHEAAWMSYIRQPGAWWLTNMYVPNEELGSQVAQVPIANVPKLWASDVGHYLAADWPFAITYHDTFVKGRAVVRNYSLRSHPKRGADVAKIAEHYNGGGHKNAAGFKLALGDARFIY